MTLFTNQIIRSFVLLFTITFLLSCSKKNEPINEPHQKTTIQGAVEKGPFVRGSVVTVYELNSDLTPTGRTFKSEISDDKGAFSLPDIDLASNYVQLSVNGYYFNEVTGSLSSSQVTLNAIADITNNKSINVNVLSHLEEKRVRSLMKKEKKTLAEAKKQALAELYASFFVKITPTTSSELVSLTKNDENANILLGISAALLKISQSDNARLTELLSIISSDLDNDGLIEEPLKQTIKQGLEDLNAKNISDNMKNRYKALNTTLADFSVDKVFTVELKGKSETSGDTHFTTEQEFQAAFSALLVGTTKATEEYFKLEGLYTKTVSGLPQNDFYLHRVNSNNPNIASSFSGLYKSIGMANTIMDYASKSSSLKSYKYKIYPYFAYNYWVLMNFWGDVPFVNPENFKNFTSPPARTKATEISQSLIAGLEEAIQNLGSTERETYVAKIVIARIAADNGNYSLAKKYLSQIIDSKQYKLANKSEVHTTANESMIGTDYDQSSAITKPNDYNLYGKGNYRSLIRYTDVILLASEVNLKLNNKEEAISLLNLVRVRNGKTTLSPNEINVLALLQEEIKDDLNNEGIFFAFLKRNNLAESSLSIPSYQKLMPIPQIEMLLNMNMVQNPGY
ncbi:RagB/SusD family nutrient uptake outer membrane protein [Pedobacter gandavensis]|uniref:RagB/SusD family nutrient uptake outer membrane protein n=1 Tax=Pedobacter gandavensis TaxID=2679963 RepID=UPI00292CF042|nr:RagB/SusD family nutrient uptake outer membrane protein [Pedobacter gandavensis]